MSFFFTVHSVRGLSKAFPAIPVPRRQGIAKVLLDYLRTSVSVINKPGRPGTVHCAMILLFVEFEIVAKNMLKWHREWNWNLICSMCIYEKQGLLNCTYANIYLYTSVCRQRIESDAQWLEANCGPFSQYVAYSDLKFFNISGVSLTFRQPSSLKTATL